MAAGAAAYSAYAVYAMYAATALAVAGTAYSAYSQRQQAKAQEEQSRVNAENEMKQGKVEANRIRELGKKQQSAARAQMAASGLDLSSNNTVTDVIESEIEQKSSQDAWNTIFNRQANASQLRTDAKNYGLQAKNATTAGVINTAGALASGYSNIQSAQKAPITSGTTLSTPRKSTPNKGWGG